MTFSNGNSNDKNKVTVYHYSRLEDWFGIENGSYVSRHKPGLGANKRVCLDYMDGWEVGAIFALESPAPSEWMDNKDFPRVWRDLKAHVGTLLLEVDVDSNDPSVFVPDWGHQEGYAWTRTLEQNPNAIFDVQVKVPQRYTHKDNLSAERAYWDGRVQIGEYLRRKDELNFSLPEVVITQNVPLERVRVSKNQPSLLEYLRRMPKSSYRDSVISKVRNVPGLAESLRAEGVLI